MKDQLPPPGSVNFGDLRRVTPIDENHGFSRGTPVDRVYINSFLDINRNDIAGRVLEMEDAKCSQRFGQDRVTQRDVLHLYPGNPDATIVGDLAIPGTLPSASFDCIIFTQALQFIYDLKSAIVNLHAALKPRGVILATLPGITQIDRSVEWSGTQHWSFSQASAARLFGEVFGADFVSIESHGNVLVALSLLHGLAAEELSSAEFLANDAAYPVIITVRAVRNAKKGPAQDLSPERGVFKNALR